MSENIILIINLATTFYLLGLILTIQVVHYPSFIYIDQKLFTKFHLFHVRKISIIVMIPMILELLAAIALTYLFPNIYAIILLALVLLTWLSTAMMSVPRHNKLSNSKNIKLISELVLTNWPRTIFWSARAIILSFLLIGNQT